MARTIHTLKVTLREVKPPVWRLIEVPSELFLSDLGNILIGVMGWAGTHLHRFDIDGAPYEVRYPGEEPTGLDQSLFRIGRVLPYVGMKATWDYEFGDGWEHELLVEAISLRKRGHQYPVCVDGRRACPPDDCGGPGGYVELLEAITNPNHPDHDELSAWAPANFDPDRFDTGEATSLMMDFLVLADERSD
jgi:hypothetical protein